jgi:hypothetical protein
MKIQLLSDVHLEANPGFCPQPAPGADVLVLAGDIGSYQRRADGSVMQEPDWGLRRFSPLPEYAGWPTPVLFCPGNHEYDGLDVDQAHTDLRRTCERLGMVWLERTAHVWQGVRFLGATLWSDFDALAEVRHAGKGLPHDPMARRLKLRERAFRAANHYLLKMQTLRHGQPFDAQAMREQALVSQDWLQAALQQPFAGPTVVVTHFAPSLHSQDPRYGINPGTAGFCNALDPWLSSAQLWLHGHLHCAQDYVLNGCRVVANPLGYADKGEQAGFDPLRLITL